VTDTNTVSLEWVCSEGSARALAARVSDDGGKVLGTRAFVPGPEESDFYSDGQFDPLVVVALALGSGMVLRYVRELVLDLTGREIMIVDLAATTPQVRVIPIGQASQVIIKAANGSVMRFAPSDVGKIEQSLAALLPQASASGA
jgi:hypothetical protein